MRDITHTSRVTNVTVTRDPRARARICGRARLRPTPTKTPKSSSVLRGNYVPPQPTTYRACARSVVGRIR